MAKKSALMINLEYGTLMMIGAVVNLMPYRLSIKLAETMGWFSFAVLRLHRERTMNRLRSVFPGKSECELRRIARLSLVNIFCTAVEMLRAPKLDRRWMDRYVLDGLKYKEKLASYIAEGKGVVVMVPHSGNWYMAAWSMARYGIELVSIAANQRNPKIDAWMKRQYCGIEVFDRGSSKTLVDIMRRLKEGCAFAILPDLRAPQEDVEVDFLGGKANVSHAGAMFAVKCGSPIVVAVMRRERGKHVFDHIGTLRPDPTASDRKAEACRLTREAMKMLDKRIQDHPEHWFWYNKRWILQPVTKKEVVR